MGRRCCLLLSLTTVACTVESSATPPGGGTDGPSGPGHSFTSASDGSDTTAESGSSGTTGINPEDCVVFVRADGGDDGNDGRGWVSAKQTVSAALETAAPDECALWIAAGVYTPTEGEDRTVSFELFPRAELYGGFNGTEAALDERDLEASRARLSGDIGVAGDASDNSHHVLIGAHEALLDGLIVEDGNTGGGGGQVAESLNGAGLLLSADSMRVVNTMFRRNRADGVGLGVGQDAGLGGFGGAIYAFKRRLVVEDSEFLDNSAGNGASGPNNGGGGGGGGAIAFQEGTELVIVNTTFSGNRCGDGGGGESVGANGGNGGAVRFIGESLTVQGCSFDGNRTGSAGSTRGPLGAPGGGGGAIDIVFGPARIEDSTFVDNRTGNGGAGAETGGSGGPGGAISTNIFGSFTLVRSRFEDNVTGLGATGGLENGAAGSGGAVLVRGRDEPTWIASCIFDGNRTGDLEQAGSTGGGVAIIPVVPDAPLGATRIVNNTFSNNEAYVGGGIFAQNNGSAPLDFVGNAFGGNAATASGGALAYEALEPLGRIPATLANSVLWGNAAPTFPELLAESSASDGPANPMQVVSSSIQDGCLPADALECGAGVGPVDPDFTDVAAGDLRPSGDALLDLGDDASVPDDELDLDDDGDVGEPLPLDLDGSPRIVGAAVDLGPYESG